MVGRRRILTTWVVREAWDILTRSGKEVIYKSFRILGLALPIDGSCDEEMSIQGINRTYLIGRINNWEREGNLTTESADNPVGLDQVHNDEENVFYEEMC